MLYQEKEAVLNHSDNCVEMLLLLLVVTLFFLFFFFFNIMLSEKVHQNVAWDLEWEQRSRINEFSQFPFYFL